MSRGNKNNQQPPPANPAIQAANMPSIFEKIAAEKLQNFRNFETSGKDITEAPGMDLIESIYGNAESLAAKKRMANPMRALSGAGSGDYANQLESLDKMERYDDRAAGLSRGLQSLKSEAYGLGGSAAELEAQRKQAYADNMLQQQEAYFNRPRKPPLWERIAGLAIGGLGAAGSAGGSRGIRGLFGGR